MAKPRIAVVSPFLDKRNAPSEASPNASSVFPQNTIFTFIAIAWRTWILKRSPGAASIHSGASSASIFLVVLANHLWRWWDRNFRAQVPEIVFSPGINCLDADAIHVHVVFARCAST